MLVAFTVAIQIEGKGVFRHVGVIDAEAVDRLAAGPRQRALEILAQAIGKHLRAGARSYLVFLGL
jgi:hypothetical protein